MVICGPEAQIRNNYAILPLNEVDLFVRVKSTAINEATTAEEFVENIDAVFPAYELAAGYVPTINGLFGPVLNGNGLLPLLNGAARLSVLGNAIPIPGTQTIAQWITTLSSIEGQEVVNTTEGPINRPFDTTVNFVTFGLILIAKLNEFGHTLKRGDILSLGTLTGVNQFNGTELQMVATYTNLDPEGPVTVKLVVDNENGLCLGDFSQCKS